MSTLECFVNPILGQPAHRNRLLCLLVVEINDFRNLIGQFVDRPLRRYNASYEGAGSVGDVEVDLIALVPKGEGVPFKRATVAVGREDGLLHRIEFTELSGQRRIIVLADIKTNIAIARSEFEFVVPDGVRVITP